MGIMLFMKEIVNKMEKALSALEDALLLILLFGILAVAISQIILRNGFSTSLSWSDASLKMAVLWLTLVGSVVAARENRHLSIDVFSKFLTGKFKRYLDAVIQLISCIICLLLMYYAVQFVKLTYEFEDLFLSRYPLWWIQLILPFGFGLMSLRFLLNIFVPQTAQDYLLGDEQPPAVDRHAGESL